MVSRTLMASAFSVAACFSVLECSASDASAMAFLDEGTELTLVKRDGKMLITSYTLTGRVAERIARDFDINPGGTQTVQDAVPTKDADEFRVSYRLNPEVVFDMERADAIFDHDPPSHPEPGDSRTNGWRTCTTPTRCMWNERLDRWQRNDGPVGPGTNPWDGNGNFGWVMQSFSMVSCMSVIQCKNILPF